MKIISLKSHWNAFEAKFVLTDPFISLIFFPTTPLIGELDLLDPVLFRPLAELLQAGVGAVGEGLVVEEYGLRGLVRLEQLVALLPVLDTLLQRLGPSLHTQYYKVD